MEALCCGPSALPRHWKCRGTVCQPTRSKQRIRLGSVVPPPGSASAPAPSPWGDDGEPARCRIGPVAVRAEGQSRGSARRTGGPASSPASATATRSPVALQRGRKSRAQASIDSTSGLETATSPMETAHMKEKKKSGERKQFFFFSCIIHAPGHFVH